MDGVQTCSILESGATVVIADCCGMNFGMNLYVPPSITTPFAEFMCKALCIIFEQYIHLAVLMTLALKSN
jgi:hypothetical protein